MLTKKELNCLRILRDGFWHAGDQFPDEYQSLVEKGLANTHKTLFVSSDEEMTIDMFSITEQGLMAWAAHSISTQECRVPVRLSYTYEGNPRPIWDSKTAEKMYVTDWYVLAESESGFSYIYIKPFEVKEDASSLTDQILAIGSIDPKYWMAVGDPYLASGPYQDLLCDLEQSAEDEFMKEFVF